MVLKRFIINSCTDAQLFLISHPAYQKSEIVRPCRPRRVTDGRTGRHSDDGRINV